VPNEENIRYLRPSATASGTCFPRREAGCDRLRRPLNGDGLRVAMVASRFNEAIVTRLVDGAMDGLRRHGVDAEAIDVAWAPGAFELPLVAAPWPPAGPTTPSSPSAP
jgi:hypothetical protein